MTALHTGGRDGLKLAAWPIALVVGVLVVGALEQLRQDANSPAWRRCRSKRGDRPDDRRETMIEARKPRRWRARLAAVTVAAGLLTAGAGITAPAVTATAPSKARPPKVAAIGKYAVGMRTETFVDSSRSTNANGDVPGKPTRTLLTAIYYPAQGVPTGSPSRTPHPTRRAVRTRSSCSATGSAPAACTTRTSSRPGSRPGTSSPRPTIRCRMRTRRAAPTSAEPSPTRRTNQLTQVL